MNKQALIATAKAMIADDKDLLAMDESNDTCDKRSAALGIPQTVDYRRAYRDLIVTTPDLGKYINGVILYDETIRQQKNHGTSFTNVILEAGIIPGIKVDIGAKDLAGHPVEKVPEALDGSRDRLKEYALDLPTSVSVPVLSNTTVVTFLESSKALLFLMSNPCFAAKAVDFATINGTANPKA